MEKNIYFRKEACLHMLQDLKRLMKYLIYVVIIRKELFDGTTQHKTLTYKFWNAPVSTCSWQREGCK